MSRQTLYRIAALAVLLAAPTAAHGQEPKPVPISEATFADGGGTRLGFAWRYHSGDDPRWADPAFDDRDWEFVEPLLWRFGRHPRDGWQGTGWFRRHLQVEPELLGKPLAVRIESPGATTVFLDGKLLMSTPVSGLRAGSRLRGGAWREVVFSPRRDHVLAVRHTLSLADRHARSRNLGFRLSIEKTDAAALQVAAERLSAMLLAVFTAVPAFLALLHLALFLSYPKARENLFYALAMVAFAAIVVSDLGLGRGNSALAVRLTAASILVTIFFFLLTYYAVRTRAFPRLWIAFAAMAGVMILWIFLNPDLPSEWGWFAYFGLMVVEVIRVEATGEKVKREGVKTLLRGFAILGSLILLQILMELGVIPRVGGEIRPYLVALLAVAVAMSIFLAQSFARTSLHLERRLDEVRALSEQVLAQERAAHEQELHRRVLEVENARQTSEIESARALQLSMLPATLPAVEGLETAAAMTTASEVGGDYYDFRIAADDSLVVAFGDATGHGVAAGIMVTAVKALFSTLGGGESLSAVLAECSRVLREMHVTPHHMCLTLARFTPRSITLCSAAMPPPLIFRAAGGEIEELGAGGPPIGSRLSGAWTEQSTALAPGDTLLFASDGYAEQLDPADQPLGYERLAEVFRASAGLPAGELVERLLARVAAWRGEREQGDDITLVVVRATS
jgi:serine phosphatase RsbU (regulator of sigma subunit)